MKHIFKNVLLIESMIEQICSQDTGLIIYSLILPELILEIKVNNILFNNSSCRVPLNFSSYEAQNQLK